MYLDVRRTGDNVSTMTNNRYRWTTEGKDFVCHEHAPDYDPELYEPGARFSVDLVTEDGPREIGAAITLMDAHQLSRLFVMRMRPVKQAAANSERPVAESE